MTRVMLVAGGDDVANFAQEVARQATLWRRAGVAATEIACYWARPTPEALRDDRRQYRRLGDAMASCAEASAARVLADIEASADLAPTYFYLYVSAHGVQNLGGGLQRWSLPPDERAFLAQPALALDADPRVRIGDAAGLLAARASGEPPSDRIALTPTSLAAALARFPASTHKIVVLQGCFSGGFLTGPGRLTAVPNTTVLTAAAADRPSFGCGSGAKETFWGGALRRTLARAAHGGHAPDAVDWHAIHVEVKRRVRALERALGQRPSHPQYGTSSAPREATAHRDAP